MKDLDRLHSSLLVLPRHMVVVVMVMVVMVGGDDGTPQHIHVARLNLGSA